MNEDSQQNRVEPEQVWTSWAPEGGWPHYVAHSGLSDAIWDSVSEDDGQWHYLNPGNDLSVWEWCADGSAILIEYDEDQIVALETSGGGAQRHFVAVTAPFGLVAQASADTAAEIGPPGAGPA